MMRLALPYIPRKTVYRLLTLKETVESIERLSEEYAKDTSSICLILDYLGDNPISLVISQIKNDLWKCDKQVILQTKHRYILEYVHKYILLLLFISYLV